MQRNPHSYQIATGYRTFYSLSLIYQPITKKRLFLIKKGNNVYAILPRYPKNKIVLKDIQTTGRTKITLLGSDKKVQWKQKGNDIEVIMPLLYVDELPCDYAWVLKLEKISE